MKKFKMECSCSDPMTVDAETREEAVKMIQAMMTEESIKEHMEKKHPGDPVMSVAQCHAEIEKKVVEVD